MHARAPKRARERERVLLEPAGRFAVVPLRAHRRPAQTGGRRRKREVPQHARARPRTIRASDIFGRGCSKDRGRLRVNPTTRRIVRHDAKLPPVFSPETADPPNGNGSNRLRCGGACHVKGNNFFCGANKPRVPSGCLTWRRAPDKSTIGLSLLHLDTDFASQQRSQGYQMMQAPVARQSESPHMSLQFNWRQRAPVVSKPLGRRPGA